MKLKCRTELASAYKAASQIVRVLSEEWCARELYCPACDSNHLSRSKNNTPGVDFSCPRCAQPFQLKSLKHWLPKKIVDAGYDAMVRCVRADLAPNLLLLNYTSEWSVRNLLLIPRVFFSESVIEKRKPLNIGARRAGWVGCNILLRQIPEDGRIAMVDDGFPVSPERVRREFSRVRKLAEVPPSLRGWTVDVLNVVRRLGKASFSLQEVYASERELRALHPRNENIRPKIRQQLQLLRDLGLIEFLRPGNYAIRS